MPSLSSGSSLSKPRPSYSLHWAAGIVRQLAEKHGRGLTFFTRYSHMTVMMLEKILARNRGEWHILRHLIAMLDKMIDLYASRKAEHATLYRIHATHLLRQAAIKAESERMQTFADWLKGLTVEWECLNLEEPDERGGFEKR